MMKPKFFIIPILIMAFVAVISAPACPGRTRNTHCHFGGCIRISYCHDGSHHTPIPTLPTIKWVQTSNENILNTTGKN